MSTSDRYQGNGHWLHEALKIEWIPVSDMRQTGVCEKIIVTMPDKCKDNDGRSEIMITRTLVAGVAQHILALISFQGIFKECSLSSGHI